MTLAFAVTVLTLGAIIYYLLRILALERREAAKERRLLILRADTGQAIPPDSESRPLVHAVPFDDDEKGWEAMKRRDGDN